jgi:energy-coupling factor transporter ATP-binding protein EcfA2
MISKLKIHSFKSVESAEIDLGSVNVFIGANGSGKSNLFEGISVLAAAAFGRVDAESLVRRGCRPGGFYRPLFRDSQIDANTTVSAEGNHTNYCVDMASPAPGRLGGWEFRREVWMHNENVVVDRETTNGTKKGDPQSGLAALRLAETPPESEAAIFLKTLASYSLYSADTPILRGWAQDPQLREPVGLSGGRLADAVAELAKGPELGGWLKDQFRAGMEWFTGFGVMELTVKTSRSQPCFH